RVDRPGDRVRVTAAAGPTHAGGDERECEESDGACHAHGRVLPDERQLVVGARVAVEAEQEDALPLAEREPAVRERDLLWAGAEKPEEHALTGRGVERHEPGEHLFEVAEEARLALRDTDQRG